MTMRPSNDRRKRQTLFSRFDEPPTDGLVLEAMLENGEGAMWNTDGTPEP
jgi:hypothetical protein